MSTLQNDIIALEPHTNKDASNQKLMLSSFLLVFPIFFMDMSNADNIEYQALRQRYNHLLAVSNKKKCPSERAPLSLDRRFLKEDKANN